MLKKTIQQLKYSYGRPLKNRLRDSYLRLRLTCPVVMPTAATRTISVAIPFFNNAKLAHVALFHILNDPRIAEIVILDDGSHPAAFKALAKKLRPFRQKVKLFRRETNWGAFANKIQAIELCSSDWVIVLDYDNTLLPDYLNAIFSLEAWHDNHIYCPGYAAPSFDFRKDLGGKVIDFDTAATMAQRRTINRPFFNDGNYLLPRHTFLQCVKPYWTYDVLADVIFANYLWLAAGNSLTVLRDAKYIHRVHSQSTWLNNTNRSLQIVEQVLQCFRDKTDPDSQTLGDRFTQTPRSWVEPTLIP
ncbi:MAG TPA: glycosyltransferase family 2 protein [Chroococcidiopsis sp.]